MESSPCCRRGRCGWPRVNVVARRQVVYRGAEVFGVDVGRCHIARLPTALAGERRVEGYGQESTLGQGLRVEARSLFFHSPERAADSHGRQFARGVFRGVEVGRQGYSVAVVERYLGVFHLVALREDLVPRLSQVQFLFHKSICVRIVLLGAGRRAACHGEHGGGQ